MRGRAAAPTRQACLRTACARIVCAADGHVCLRCVRACVVCVPAGRVCLRVGLCVPALCVPALCVPALCVPALHAYVPTLRAHTPARVCMRVSMCALGLRGLSRGWLCVGVWGWWFGAPWFACGEVLKVGWAELRHQTLR